MRTGPGTGLIVLMEIKWAVAGQHCARGDRKGGETGEDPWFIWNFVIELILKINFKHDVNPTWQSLLLGIKQCSFLLSDLKNRADTRLRFWVVFIKNFEQKALRSKCQVFRYFGYDVLPATTCLIIIINATSCSHVKKDHINLWVGVPHTYVITVIIIHNYYYYYYYYYRYYHHYHYWCYYHYYYYCCCYCYSYQFISLWLWDKINTCSAQNDWLTSTKK